MNEITGARVFSSVPFHETEKRGGNMRKTLIISILLTALVMATTASAQKDSSGNVKTSIKKVTLFGSSTVVPAAGSTVMRNNEGVYWNISTSSLTPGEVVTLWVAFFNYPFYCDQSVPGCTPSDLNNPAVQGSLQYGGGAIVDASGRADFSGYLAVGDNTGANTGAPVTTIPNPAPGLLNPKGADIHLVIRRHGPASSDPAILQAQLSSFGGGCNIVGACANIQASVHEP
jgi:hypothetical protein